MSQSTISEVFERLVSRCHYDYNIFLKGQKNLQHKNPQNVRKEVHWAKKTMGLSLLTLFLHINNLVLHVKKGLNTNEQVQEKHSSAWYKFVWRGKGNY